MVRLVELCARYAALGFVFLLVSSATAQSVYWTDIATGTIQRLDLDGGLGVELLVTSEAVEPVDIALDINGGKMYWTEASIADFQVMRSNLDGTNVELLVTHLTTPTGIDLDTSAGKIYWTDIGAGKIQRANLDGTGVEDLVTDSAVSPVDVTIDPVGQKLYWTEELAADFMIRRANLDGSNVEGVVTGVVSPNGIAVDPTGGKIYWTDVVSGKIQRANLDGSDVEDLVTTAAVEPVRLALDQVAGKMYWTERSPADFMILRSNLDGSNVEFLITGLTSPSGIALVGGRLGQAFVPVAQARSVGSFVTVPPCEGEDGQNEKAPDFGPFESTVGAIFGCPLALGHALTSQTSQINNNSMHATGQSFSQAIAESQTVIHAIAGSSFDVTVELPLTAAFALDGELTIEAISEALPGIFAHIELVPQGGDPLLQRILSAGVQGMTVNVSQSGFLTPGVYVVRASAQTTIDNQVPEDLLAEVTYRLSFQAANGDRDADADVDLVDFREFTACSAGPNTETPTACEPFDFDFDGDVDSADFGTFQLLYTGPS